MEHTKACELVMPQFGSEPWFEPELLEPDRKFGPKFRETVEPNLKFSSRFKVLLVGSNLNRTSDFHQQKLLILGGIFVID